MRSLRCLRWTAVNPSSIKTCPSVLRTFKRPTTYSTRFFATKRPTDKINYNTELSLSSSNDDEHVLYKKVTANDLEKRTDPPKRVKMLVRDFIEDSLYNPNYGYFPKQATIFTSENSTLDFSGIRDSNEFQALVAEKFLGFGIDGVGPGRQIFHTPTELFKPWYGQALARCLVSEYLLKYFPYEDFNLYEIGAGNGTLANDILDYIRDKHPEVYERTRYTIIEISGQLAKKQRKKLGKAHPCVTVANKSIFHWDVHEPSPCFVVAMEVIDNFAHDMIRYDLKTLEPYQTYVSVDDNGDFSTHYTRVSDPLISSFMNIRNILGHRPPLSRLMLSSPLVRNVITNLPFSPNLSKPEYIPTRLLSLLMTLRTKFPLHRLLLSDFSTLPDTVPGYNAPVVQTRVQNTMVACSSLLVRQGYFDIFFPTDFSKLRDMYEFVLAQPVSSGRGASAADLPTPRTSPLASSVSPLALGSEFFSSHPRNRRKPVDGVVSASGLPVGPRKSNVFTHAEFMETYANLDKTRLRSGENPLLDFYKNVKFLF